METTAEHPFYTDDGVWVDAGELEVGEQILSLGGVYGAVEAVVVVEDANQPMYNLTVDEVHTFAVGNGDWVVHNALLPNELDTVTYSQSRAYTGLTGHHMPSKAYMSRNVNVNPSDPTKAYSEYSALTLLLPDSIHSKLSTTKRRFSAQGYGSDNPYEALRRDIQDVRKAYQDAGSYNDKVEAKLKAFEAAVIKLYANLDVKYFDPEYDPSCE